MSVQFLVQFHRAAIGQALHGTGGGVAPKQQVGLARQVSCLGRFHRHAGGIEHGDFCARCDKQAGFHRAAIAQWNANAGIGADQAFPAYRDDDVTAAGQGANSRAAAAEV